MKAENCSFVLSNLVNFAYLISGTIFVGCGIIILADQEKILLSKMIPVNTKEPVYYSVCICLLIIGLIVAVLSTLGCWAINAENQYIFSLYLFAVLLFLLAECVFACIVLICPQYVGMSLSKERMTDMWQRNYGVPGKEQYTAAVDLAQIRMKCCGISGSKDFSTSWWNLRDLAAPNLTVPLSCCVQDPHRKFTYLDPIPLNPNMCQHQQLEKYAQARHIQGCFEPLERWLDEQKKNILLIGSQNFAVGLLIMLSAIFKCVSHSERPNIYSSNIAIERKIWS